MGAAIKPGRESINQLRSAVRAGRTDLTFRWASLTAPVESITPDAKLPLMGLLWMAETTTMWQRLTLLTALLSVFLNRWHGRALLARVQASNLGEADRALVTRILRAA